MIHFLHDILNHNFHGRLYDINYDEDNIISCEKIPVYSSGTKNNFGEVLLKLESYLPNLYSNIDNEKEALISNSNRLSTLGWYIDSNIDFSLKENIPKVTSYRIPNYKSKLYISKPSHPYIGSGKYIMIGSRDEVEKRKDIYYKKEKLNWVVQPLLTNLIFWNDKYKFDIRTYALIFNEGDKFRIGCYKLGVIRRCINEHDPLNDISSAITNISVQEKIHGYDAEFHMPLYYDDKSVGMRIMKDVISKVRLTRDHRKKIQFLILGLDIIFMSDGTPRLIEINKSPYLEVNSDIENNEKVASEGFIIGLFGYILPCLINNRRICKVSDWEFY